MTAKLSAEEKTPLRQAWSDYLVSDEYQRAAQTAVFSDAMFQSFAYAFAAGSLRSSAQVREAEVKVTDLRGALRSVLDTLGNVWGDPEDCDDCAGRADADGEPCALHGDCATPLYHAIQRAIELLGPCICGHAKSQHNDVDGTDCGVCECARFALQPEPLPPPPAQREGESK